MRIKILSIFFFCLGILISANAQYHTPVLPGMSGQTLLNGLVGNYKPSTVLDYSNARDTMFANIYSHNDSLTCVYSGHTIYLDPNEDPTVAAYMNGGTNGINTEHTWPQAAGAANGNARSNIYHLFPTRIEVNADRANSPFLDIEDSQADEWYYLNQSQSSIPPSSTIDLYSEREGSAFEPREGHKGDVARAMFYFYTMYKTEADNADPNFFEIQRATLCAWHLQDPVDEKEWQRNIKIASYQSDRENPFILDCTLPERCYCEDQNQFCTPNTLDANEPEPLTYKLEQNYPNPFTESTSIKYQLEKDFEVRLVVYNILGQAVKVLVDQQQGAGEYQLTFNIGDLAVRSAGVYTYRLELKDGKSQYFETRKFLIGM